MLSKLMDNPKRPLVAIVGGAKIADKVGAIQNLARIADTVLVGGGVANNFLKAEGIDVLNSYLQGTVADESKRGIDFVAFAKKLLARFKKKNGLLLHGYIPIPKIVAPVDVIAADKIKNFKTKCTLNFINPEASNCPEENLMFLDIGPSTITLYQDIIKAAKTIFWNGPLGVFEEPSFSKGTRKIADAVAKSSATSFLGGGDTIAAIAKFKLQNKYDYVSAAGGASLEFLAGKQLPGLEPMKIK